MQVILKVLKTEVNCFDLPIDKCIAVIAVDHQGQFVKNISNDGQVGKLDSDHPQHYRAY